MRTDYLMWRLLPRPKTIRVCGFCVRNIIFLSNPCKFQKLIVSLPRINKRLANMSKKEREEKVKEFWEYYESTQGSITITDPVVLD